MVLCMFLLKVQNTRASRYTFTRPATSRLWFIDNYHWPGEQSYSATGQKLTRVACQLCAFIDYRKLKVSLVGGEYGITSNTLSRRYHRKLFLFALKCKVLILNHVGKQFECGGKAFVTWKEAGRGVPDAQTNAAYNPDLQKISHWFVLTLAVLPQTAQDPQKITVLSLIC